MKATSNRYQVSIEADPALPIIRITRDFNATPTQLMRAHTDPELFARWIGPNQMETKILDWDATTGGRWRYVARATATSTASMVAFTRSARIASCRLSPSMVSLMASPSRRCGSRTSATAAPACTLSRWWTASKAATNFGERHGDRRRRGLRQTRRPPCRAPMSSPADEHRWIAGEFTMTVEGVAPESWNQPAPPEGWVAHDVVRHLVEWFPAFLQAGAGITLSPGPSVDDDPVGAWRAQSNAVQALLDDAGTVDREHDLPHIGRMPLGQAIDMIYTGDVFLHRWDLARATGQDETLDPSKCAAMLEGMLPMDEVLRQSGQYGRRVHVPDDADVQTKLLAFIGRTP